MTEKVSSFPRCCVGMHIPVWVTTVDRGNQSEHTDNTEFLVPTLLRGNAHPVCITTGTVGTRVIEIAAVADAPAQ